MWKNNRSSQCLSLPKSKKKMISKKSPLISKPQLYPRNLQSNEKQDHKPDSDREKSFFFTEIWPTSERSSLNDTPTTEKNVQKSSRIKSSELDTPHSAVLARYVNRFRHGQPQSREERRQQVSSDRDEQLPFWWASASSLPASLTPEETDHRLLCEHPPHNQCIGSVSISDTSNCELVESEILQLQEKANRLLQKGELGFEDDSLPVSSEGVGCSDFSSPVSADDPVRISVISSLLPSNIARDLSPAFPSLISANRPEEDILFQWRLRRKMEKAREWTQAQQSFKPQDLHSAHPLMTLQTIQSQDLPQGALHQQTREPVLTTSDQQTEATTTTTTTTTRPTIVEAMGSLVSPPQALAHVPSHMHLLCDILPCPSLHSYPREESVSQRLHSDVVIQPQKTLNSVTKCTSPPKSSVSGSAKKDLNLAQENSTKGPKKHLEKREKRASVLPKQSKKSEGRVHSRHRISQQQKQKYAEGNKITTDTALPSSAIHSALGEVVSDVLFPSVDSTIASEISPAPLPCSSFEPQQCKSHKSGDVISQLLQEAQDSDEKEFEMDELLQVLRKQRQWVKEQINEVDALLKKF